MKTNTVLLLPIS